MKHHAIHSGYHRLLEFIDDSRNVSSNDFSRIMQVLTNNRLCDAFFRQLAGMRFYSSRAFCTEAAMIRLALRNPGQIFHFIYGDDMYRFAGTFRRWFGVDASLICSFHQPPDHFAKIVHPRRHLGALDAAIIVGNNQREMLAPHMVDDRIFFVPHGIDTDFFRPRDESASASNDVLTCLTVGNWLRDFDTLRRVMCQVNADHVAVRFVVVTFPANFQHLQGCRGVEFKSGVSDLVLRDLYQSADVLLLPLLDCTANNSLLEGLACGLPVVVTDVGGVRDYVDDSCAVLTPVGDAEAMTTALVSLASQPTKRRQMGTHSRARALQFSWTEVASQMMQVYLGVQ